ncbi:C40 family peptidase [Streptomyces tropicalis]|uniref:NlpC/P60 family protein n=1 Tax=Streptomyces tropicalis TaxID=3034234 RepID=A0ABT6A8U2_9ACTN|nr:NlpC/P60 family protein [Streptomyces tropicalis]MDF3301075.1 NlpC/P60 family protein [Streptomyces tropicalis]
MAAHRRHRQRTPGGGTARTAVTIALAGAATATGFEGTGHADPQPTPGQVRAKVERLYQEAETATEQYDGAREKADAAEGRIRTLGDRAARAQQELNTARDALGTVAAAQYRDGGFSPTLHLMLSDDPGQYLDGAEFAERAGVRQSAAVARVRRRLREIDQLRAAAHDEVTSLRAHQAELKRQKGTVTGKLAEARRLLARLSPGQRASVGGDGGTGRASRLAGDVRDALGAAGSAAAPTSRAAAAITYAQRKLGSPYVWGATGPDAFDCSGLIQAAYRSAGVSLPRTTYAQINAGRRVSRSELLPGDLVFFYSGISHVGLYIGNGMMIHAPNPSAPVRVAPIDQMPFAGATRVA